VVLEIAHDLKQIKYFFIHKQQNMIGFKIIVNNNEVIAKADSLVSIQLDVCQMERKCSMIITERNIKTIKNWPEISLNLGDVIKITTIKSENNDFSEPIQCRDLERLKKHYYQLKSELKDKGLIA